MADITSDLKSDAAGPAQWTRGKWASVILLVAVALTVLRYAGLLPDVLHRLPDSMILYDTRGTPEMRFILTST